MTTQVTAHLTFDVLDPTAVDQALDIIHRIHPTAIAGYLRDRERATEETAALAEVAARPWCTCVGTRGYHRSDNPLCDANVRVVLSERERGVRGRQAADDAEVAAWHPAVTESSFPGVAPI